MTASAWNLIKLDATKILHSLTESDIVRISVHKRLSKV